MLDILKIYLNLAPIPKKIYFLLGPGTSKIQHVDNTCVEPR